MKLLKEDIDRNRSGSVRLEPEEPEDMWHLYNIIQKGDQIFSKAMRQVGIKNETSTGSVTTTRITTSIQVCVEDVFFDIQAATLRVKGRNVTENKYIQMGQYHTIDLELNEKLTLLKEHWDSITLQRVRNACDATKQADVAAVMMQDGLANVCLLTQHMTIVRQRIEVPIPKKKRGSTTNHDKGIRKFYEQVYRAIQQHIDFDIIKVIILGSPGFIKDKFFEYMLGQAVKDDDKITLTSKGKFLLVHTTSGHKRAIEEVMRDPQVKARMENTKAAEETKALGDFYKMLSDDPDRAYYGFNHVLHACENQAIGTLMITDGLIRSADVETRRKYIKLVEDTQALNGKVLIFSSLHVSGEQLQQLSGVAAILTFPLPEIESGEEEESES
ncbi:Translation factor pelota [Mycoemilia scoparia]|uniref:Protein DOM34 homolog n=1 Tax=Mycoemilia scoparia TaxID=417184 RepID=A0A9W8A106_9FUNG|nr:Translation factor pelota [Mycoemilia scoparia]